MDKYEEQIEKFLTDYSSNEELARAVLDEGGVDYEYLVEYTTDYSDASNGSVIGLIYYEDTVKFGKKNQDLILDQMDYFEEQIGGKLDKPKRSDKTQYYNWLTWFAWENMIGELMDFLEQ